MATVGPDWRYKLDILTRGLEWASGVCGVWKFQHEAFNAPRNNDPWFELRMMRVFEVAPDETINCDNIDPGTGEIDVENPRKEVTVGQREFRAEFRAFGRDQEHDTVAWVIADRTRSRMRMPYFRNNFLDRTPRVDDPSLTPSANISIVELFDVFAMPPTNKVTSDRWQSEAVLEMRLATSTAEDDPAAVGTWVEAVEVSSNLLQPDGVTPLDPSIQLDRELIDAR